VARIAGRNSWIAWPVGVICAAVVGTLAYLAQPMIPVSAMWMGEMFYSATHQPPPAAAEASVASGLAVTAEIDCRTMYPDDLWAELTWAPDVLLSQNTAAPATAVTALIDALAPTVLRSCSWRAEGGVTIATTLAQVGADAGALADAALRGQGFSCTTDGAVLTCERTEDSVLEEHVVRDGLWLSSVESSWQPTAYGDRLARHVFG
jgi:hypothetical protein